ncbi:hypothetical protein SVIOM342S_10502 [Streptomyces violaceorubidus]
MGHYAVNRRGRAVREEVGHPALGGRRGDAGEGEPHGKFAGAGQIGGVRRRKGRGTAQDGHGTVADKAHEVAGRGQRTVGPPLRRQGGGGGHRSRGEGSRSLQQPVSMARTRALSWAADIIHSAVAVSRSRGSLDPDSARSTPAR